MDVVGAFVGINSLKIHHMPDYMVFIGNTVTTVHISCMARDLQSLPAIIALDQRNHGGIPRPFIHDPANP